MNSNWYMHWIWNHRKDLPGAVWVFRWLSRVDLTVNCLEQLGQVNGFSPVWIRVCLTRSLGFLKLLGQWSHWFRYLCRGYSFTMSFGFISLIRSFSAVDSSKTFSEIVIASDDCVFRISSASSLVSWMMAWLLFGWELKSELFSASKQMTIKANDCNIQPIVILHLPVVN